MQLEYVTKSDGVVEPVAVTGQRRYDVDWLRVLALTLLIVYHAAISFQSWGDLIGFPKNEQFLDGLMIIMAMLNIWRIPILFLISGMGVRFAMERRDWKQLLKDRTVRILLPLVFGLFFIAPINNYVSSIFYGEEPAYIPNPGHLWFLANIFLYVLLLLPLFVYLKKRPDNILFRFLSELISWPPGLFLLALPLMLEAWLVNPELFALYILPPHGFLLGLICFMTGFIVISVKDVFWSSVERLRWVALGIAFLLYLVRLLVFKVEAAPNWLTAFESMSWMLTILGMGSLHLNKPSRLLSYCSPAVYPVYILHLPVQFIFAYFLLPLPLSASLKLLLLSLGTLGISILLYELVLSRLRWIRPLFGMKLNQQPPVKAGGL